MANSFKSCYAKSDYNGIEVIVPKRPLEIVEYITAGEMELRQLCKDVHNEPWYEYLESVD